MQLGGTSAKRGKRVARSGAATGNILGFVLAAFSMAWPVFHSSTYTHVRAQLPRRHAGRTL